MGDKIDSVRSLAHDCRTNLQHFLFVCLECLFSSTVFRKIEYCRILGKCEACRRWYISEPLGLKASTNQYSLVTHVAQ